MLALLFFFSSSDTDERGIFDDSRYIVKLSTFFFICETKPAAKSRVAIVRPRPPPPHQCSTHRGKCIIKRIPHGWKVFYSSSIALLLCCCSTDRLIPVSLSLYCCVYMVQWLNEKRMSTRRERGGGGTKEEKYIGNRREINTLQSDGN